MLQIHYQDEHICVIEKEAGHVVHRTPGSANAPIILQGLRNQLKKRIFPVHRLDQATSGCLAFAFSSLAAKKLQESLQSDSCEKKYLALCRGDFKNSEGVFDRELSNERKQKQTAITKYKVIQKFESYTLLELQILTGRRHQIRRHLAHAAHHIVGDVRYGKGWLNRKFREEFDFHRLFLHCHQLSFLHPFEDKKIKIKSKLPLSLDRLIQEIHE